MADLSADAQAAWALVESSAGDPAATRDALVELAGLARGDLDVEAAAQVLATRARADLALAAPPPDASFAALLAAEFREADHPRVPGGGEHGGEFTSKPGKTAGHLPDPPDAELRASLLSWVKSWKNSGRIQRDMTRLIRNPDAAASPDARNILGALQHRAQPSPVLWRGMWWAPGDPKAARFLGKLKEGGTIDLPVASFSADKEVTGAFAHPADGRECGASVLITVEAGARAYDIAGAGVQAFQAEQVTGGRFEVVSVGVNPIPQDTITGYEAMGLTEGLARLRANAAKNYAVTLRQVQGV